MLTDLRLFAAYKIVGRSRAEFFSLVTGLSRKRWDRGTALAAFAERLLEGDGEDMYTAMLLQLMAPPRVATKRLPRGALNDLPGICAVLARGLGVLDDESSPWTWDLLCTFDAADRLLVAAVENNDVEAFRHEFAPGTVLSPAYLALLPVAESAAVTALPDRDREVVRLLLRRRAHMALSYLACADHELQ